MYCKNCGKELKEKSDICLECGVRKGNGKDFCPSCGNAVSPYAEVCVKCGLNLLEEKKNSALIKKFKNLSVSSKWLIGIIAIVLISISVGLSNNKNDSSNLDYNNSDIDKNQSVKNNSENSLNTNINNDVVDTKDMIKPQKNVFSDEMYKVGVDISAGNYYIVATSSSGYYCISTDSLADDIVANDNFKGNSYITVQDGQYLKLSRCDMISVSDMEPLRLSGTISDGMYRVGIDIPAGEYLLTTEGRGYYCISTDSLADDIVANDNFKGNSYITVQDGQYLKLSRCSMNIK